jgi:hypothetical protein
VQLIPEIAPKVNQLTVFPADTDLVFPQVRRSAAARLALGAPGAGRQVRPGALSQAYVEINFPLSANYFGVLPPANGARSIGLS